jgi:hypothetical protein
MFILMHRIPLANSPAIKQIAITHRLLLLTSMATPMVCRFQNKIKKDNPPNTVILLSLQAFGKMRLSYGQCIYAEREQQIVAIDIRHESPSRIVCETKEELKR